MKLLIIAASLFVGSAALGACEITGKTCRDNWPPSPFSPRIDAAHGVFVGEPLECEAWTTDPDGDSVRFAFSWWFIDYRAKTFREIEGAHSQIFFPTRAQRHGEIVCGVVAYDGRGGATTSVRSEAVSVVNRGPSSVDLACPDHILLDRFDPGAAVPADGGCSLRSFSDPDGDSPEFHLAMRCDEGGLSGMNNWQHAVGGRDAPCFLEVLVTDGDGLVAKKGNAKIPIVNRYSLPFASWINE